MAAVTPGVTLNVTTNAATYTTGSFTPTLNDLLVAFVLVTGTAAAGSMTDSLGGGWTQITTAVKAASADKLWCFIRTALSSGAALTVTMDVTGDNGTGCVLFVALVSSMTRTGADAARQSAIQSNQAASGTPAPAFPASALTGNPTLGFVGNATNPATLTVPTGWTEQADVGFATPTSGGEYVSRDSGFTGTTITWGGTSASAFGDIIVELDTSVASAGIALLVAAGYAPEVLPPDDLEIHALDTSILWDHRPYYDDLVAFLFERDASIEELVITGYSPDLLPPDLHETHELETYAYDWSHPASYYDDLVAFLFERDASIEELIAGYSPDVLPADIHETHEDDPSIYWDHRPYYDDILAVLFPPEVAAAIEELIAAGYAPDLFSVLEEVLEEDSGPQGELYEWFFITEAGLDIEVIIATNPYYGLLGSPTHEDYYPFDPGYYNIWPNDIRRHRLYWGTPEEAGAYWKTANL